MDTVFFWISKLAWLLIRPDTLLLLAVAAGVICLYAGARRRAGAIFTLVFFCMLIITVVPVGNWLLSPLENRFPTNPELPETVDGIIVLAGPENGYKSALWDQAEIGEAAERLFYFLKLMKDYPDARFVFTGGSGSLTGQVYKSADVAKRLFDELGIDTTRITFEPDSRNTYENGFYTRKLVKPEPGENWILITTAWHMARSVGIFENLGWQVIPFPVDHRTKPAESNASGFNLTWDFLDNLDGLQTGIKEWVGLGAYYLTGKTSALFPPAGGGK
ncbi:MAG TPA: YdcF family protein [Desulfobacteraceae bacterium]|nr:YdcF family protein [Desulfobacteraceae bacterium]